MIQTQHHKDFEKAIRGLAYRHPLWRVFSDYCEMSALSLSNAVIKDEAREARYMEIVKAYTPEEIKIFPELLGITTSGLEGIDCDFLGELFMQMELSSHWHGQFFTPFAVCKMMAGMTITDGMEEIINQKGFFTVQEPACGAGATIIGLVGAMLDKKLNPQTQMHVTAVDVDPTAAHMCYVQLSLLGIPAVVYVGNTLSMKMTSAWYTPFHHLGLWENKLRRGYAFGSGMDKARVDRNELIPVVLAPEPAQETLTVKQGQLDFDFKMGAA